MTASVPDLARNADGAQSPSPANSAYLHPGRVIVGLAIASRKRLFEEFAQLIARSIHAGPANNAGDEIMGRPDMEQIFATLYDRERLGSTGLGRGIALPHGRIDGLLEPVIAIARLANPIDYDAPDGLPVWLAVCLLVPTAASQTHLNLLAALAAKFNDDHFIGAAQEADSAGELYNLFAVT